MSTALALLLAALTVSELAGGVRFPEVQARRLDGRAITLPGGLDGQVNLLLIAFQREQQAEVDTWIPAAEALAERHPGVEWYELPTLGALPGFLRFFIDSGMRGGITGPDARARTITLYLDKAKFRAALGLGNEDTIYVLLIDRKGNVLWATSGALAGEAAPEGLVQAVTRAIGTYRS